MKEEGYIVAYLPHAEQVASFVKSAEQNNYQTFTIEVITREIITRERGTRPQNTGLTHTAYITFCKKPSKL